METPTYSQLVRNLGDSLGLEIDIRSGRSLM